MQNPELWQTIIGDMIIPLVFTFLTPFIVMLARRGVDVVERWLDLRWNETQKQRIDEVIRDAIAYTEEQSRKAVKHQKTFEEFHNAEKVDVAIAYMRRRAHELDLDDLYDATATDLSERLEARLFQERQREELGLKPSESDPAHHVLTESE